MSAQSRSNTHFNVPNLVFDNRDQLAASQFDIVDQYGEAFHVVVARMAYTLGARGADGLAPLRAQVPPARLYTEDQHIGGDTLAGTLQESDFAPYKPRCDVIVNGVAHAPRGQPIEQFGVRLVVLAGAGAHAPATLVDKALLVFGERWFKKKMAVMRMAQGGASVATLGLLRSNPWTLSAPEKCVQLPLLYAHAWGGQCRIDADDPAFERLPKKVRPPAGAAMHDSSPANPLGCGFVRHWFLDAKDISSVAAPRIVDPAHPCDAERFWRAAGGADLPAPGGLAPVGRGWLPRRLLAGHIKEKTSWGADEVPLLPQDFDFAYWNSAPPDQQCPRLDGQEQFSLTNLCRHDHPGAGSDAKGNTILRFVLPEQAMFLMLTDRDGKVNVQRLAIDAVSIAPEAASVDLVWRTSLPADGHYVAARLMHITEHAQIGRLQVLEQLQEAMDSAPDTPPDAAGKTPKKRP